MESMAWNQTVLDSLQASALLKLLYDSTISVALSQ